jgi:aldehyde:ferredoxin oxidoreductase
VRLLPARQLWGRPTTNAANYIRADMKDPWRSRELRVLSIGPAGERQAAVASLVADGCLVPGAAGLGAVLGAKNLKAIAVRGTAGVTVANGGLFLRVVSTLLNKLATALLTAEALPRHGTPFLFRHLAAHGALPEGWFGEAVSEWRGDLSPQRLAGYRRAARACFACPIGCLQLSELKGTLLSGEGKGPEYDALAQFGVVCGVDSLPAILSANYRCTEEGLDPVAAGGTVACAMSLYRDGLLTKADTGCELGFGEAEALLGCLGLMARGEGLGSLLAQGSRRLCQELGRPERFLGVRGLELPPYEVRAIQGLGLHFATAGGGPLDLSGLTLIDEVLGVHRPPDALKTEGKPALVKLHQDAAAALDSLGVCVLPLMGLWVNNLVPAFRSVTGMELGAEDLLAAGERAVNLERLWNLAAGIPGSADRLPQKLLTEPLEAGPAKGRVCELDKMLPEYYELRGWDASGKPTAAKLDGLGLRV